MENKLQQIKSTTQIHSSYEAYLIDAAITALINYCYLSVWAIKFMINRHIK